MLSDNPAPSEHLFLAAKQPVPFEDLFSGLVVESTRRRDLALDEASPRISDEAGITLQRSLLLRLGNLFAEVLYRKFYSFRINSQKASRRIILPPASHEGRALYDRFVTADRAGLLRDIFEIYPVLARLLGTVLGQWIETTAEFLNHLSRDWPLIEQTLLAGQAADRVTDIRQLASDPHNGGRGAYVLTFDDQRRIVYKPRPLDAEGAWRRLLAWLDEMGAPPSADAASVLPCDGYGWMAWVEAAPGRTDADIEIFFERVGSLLCLFHLMNGTDLHFENIIADGPAPVPVDLETLMHPRTEIGLDAPGAGSALAVAVDVLKDSVLWTGLLPSWVMVRNRQLFGIGGLNARDLDEIEQHRFCYINTDSMALETVLEAAKLRSNLPVLSTAFDSFRTHAPHISAGFERMWSFMQRHRDAILAREGPLSAFKSLRTRVILRPTQLYFLVLKRALALGNLTDGAAWSAQFDDLARLAARSGSESRWHDVHRAECRALARLDIPYFSVRTDGHDLETRSGPVLQRCFAETPFDATVDRISGLSADDLPFQLSLIQHSMEAADFDLRDGREDATAPIDDADNSPVPDAKTIARDLAKFLKATSIGGSGAIWISISPVMAADHAQIDITGYDLYAGTSGIALFFSALERVEGSGIGRTFAVSALAPLVRDLEDRWTGRRLAAGLGAGTGLGSIIYALVRIADLLEDPTLLEVVSRAARRLTSDAIAADRYLDVMDGVAGTILGLLALHRATGETWVLDKAAECGDHLLTKRSSLANGLTAWHTVAEQPLAGMAHGAAGIALALLRLAATTGEESYRQAAQQGLAYERSLFDAAHGNWPDLRQARRSDQAGTTPSLCRWCHGAAGIGLARLAGMDVLFDEVTAAEVKTALETTSRRLLGLHDGLCCGNFGRIEFVFSAGRKFGRDNLVQRARQAAAILLRRQQAAGSFQWPSGGDRYNPGFYTGIAGIGYQLLRLENPQLLPSVLSWE